MNKDELKSTLIQMFKNEEIRIETEIDQPFDDDFFIETYVKIGEETVQYYKSRLPYDLQQ